MDHSICTACCCSVLSALNTFLFWGKAEEHLSFLNQSYKKQTIQMGPDELMFHFFNLNTRGLVCFCTVFQCILLLIIPLRLLFRSQEYVFYIFRVPNA